MTAGGGAQDDGELSVLLRAAICRLRVRRGDRDAQATAFAIGADRLMTAASAVAAADSVSVFAHDGTALSLSPSGVLLHPAYRPGERDEDLAILRASPARSFLALAELTFTPSAGLLVHGYPQTPSAADPRAVHARGVPGTLSPSGASFTWLPTPPAVGSGAPVMAALKEGLRVIGVQLSDAGGSLLRAQSIRWALSA